MSYAIRFYRSKEWADRFAQVGVTNKPEGMAVSPIRYTKLAAAQQSADAINKNNPVIPCEVIEVP